MVLTFGCGSYVSTVTKSKRLERLQEKSLGDDCQQMPKLVFDIAIDDRLGPGKAAPGRREPVREAGIVVLLK
jgi:hypothetical protein